MSENQGEEAPAAPTSEEEPPPLEPNEQVTVWFEKGNKTPGGETREDK